MQLNEILEEHTIKTISQKTNITVESLEELLSSDFSNLKRLQALGFISIIEREYNASLSLLKEEAYSFYREHEENREFVVKPSKGDDAGSSKTFIFLVLISFIYVSWYFFTQFSERNLNDLTPFKEVIERFMDNDEKSSSKELIKRVKDV